MKLVEHHDADARAARDRRAGAGSGCPRSGSGCGCAGRPDLVEAHRVADGLADALRPARSATRVARPAAPAAAAAARPGSRRRRRPRRAARAARAWSCRRRAAPRRRPRPAPHGAAIAVRQSSIGSGCSATAGYDAPAPASIEVNLRPSDLERTLRVIRLEDRAALRCADHGFRLCESAADPVISGLGTSSADQVRAALFT